MYIMTALANALASHKLHHRGRKFFEGLTMKGIESMPLKIVVTLVMIAVIVGVAFWQLNYFLGFKSERDFKEDLTNLFQTIKTTQSFGDKGSFTTVWVNVPQGSNFSISIGGEGDTDGNTTTAYVNGKKFSYIFTANITKIKNDTALIKSGYMNFSSGSYTFRAYYGTVSDGEEKLWTVYFE